MPQVARKIVIFAALASVTPASGAPRVDSPWRTVPVPNGAVETLRPTHEWSDLAARADGLRRLALHHDAADAYADATRGVPSLAPWATFLEARTALDAGDPVRAIDRCFVHRDRWPSSFYAPSCQRVLIEAFARVGDTERALSLAADFDRDHPKHPIGDHARMWTAESLLAENPTRALPVLRDLVAHHESALIGHRAEALLTGHLPDDVPIQRTGDLAWWKARAESLRDAGRRDDAWRAFEELAARPEPEASRWAAIQRNTFGWRTHRWEDLISRYQAAYRRQPTAQLAWNLWRVLARAGRHAEAAAVIHRGLLDHGSEVGWRHKREAIARELMLARRYEAAVRLFDEVAQAGGIHGRRAAYYGAISSYLRGDRESARVRLDRIIDRGDVWEAGARYWRHRLDSADRAGDAAWLAEHEPESWYGWLASRPVARPGLHPHTGRWPVQTAATAPSIAPWLAGAPARHAGARLGDVPPPAGFAGHPNASTDPSMADAPWNRSELDASIDQLLAELDRDAELQLAVALSRRGLYHHAGPLVAAAWTRWERDASRDRSLEPAWRTAFVFAQDHHHAVRRGLPRAIRHHQDRVWAERARWPVAYADQVWAAARRHDVDPYLLLAVMRVESVYDTLARSHVGAIGLMQMMPRTGYLLADRMDDPSFHILDLHDAETSIEMGAAYFAALLERFDGAYPMAIAAYNGGPHHMSAWLAAGSSHMPLDVFVEHIPFQETRRYVKRVMAAYVHYVDTWEHGHATVPIPAVAEREVDGVIAF